MFGLEDMVSIHMALHFKEIFPSFLLQLTGSELNEEAT